MKEHIMTIKMETNKVKKYRGFGKKVYEFIKNSPTKFIKNTDIEIALKCDNRTIKRWTAKMQKDDIIIKKQETQKSVNEYTILV